MTGRLRFKPTIPQRKRKRPESTSESEQSRDASPNTPPFSSTHKDVIQHDHSQISSIQNNDQSQTTLHGVDPHQSETHTQEETQQVHDDTQPTISVSCTKRKRVSTEETPLKEFPRIDHTTAFKVLEAYEQKQSRKRSRRMSSPKKQHLEETRHMRQQVRPENETQSTQPVTSSYKCPQVRLVNGVIVLDSTDDEGTDTHPEGDHREVVEESGTRPRYRFRNRIEHPKWTAEEMNVFYKALAEVGCNFEAIAERLPNRTRNEVKTRYKIEEKLQPLRLERTLYGGNAM